MKLRFGLTVLILIGLASGSLCLTASAAEYDVNWDGTADFTVIQEAIDASVDGDVIVVHPGTYYENIHFDGKNITLSSLDPEDEEIIASTIIDAQRESSVVTFAGTEDERCLISGFTITNGRANYGGGLDGEGAGAAIRNCTVSRNSAQRKGGGLCRCDGPITNSTISRNTADDGGRSGNATARSATARSPVTQPGLRAAGCSTATGASATASSGATQRARIRSCRRVLLPSLDTLVLAAGLPGARGTSRMTRSSSRGRSAITTCLAGPLASLQIAPA